MEKLGFRTKRTSDGRHFVGIKIKNSTIEMYEVSEVSGSEKSYEVRENIGDWYK